MSPAQGAVRQMTGAGLSGGIPAGARGGGGRAIIGWLGERFWGWIVLMPAVFDLSVDHTNAVKSIPLRGNKDLTFPGLMATCQPKGGHNGIPSI